MEYGAYVPTVHFIKQIFAIGLLILLVITILLLGRHVMKPCRLEVALVVVWSSPLEFKLGRLKLGFLSLLAYTLVL